MQSGPDCGGGNSVWHRSQAFPNCFAARIYGLFEQIAICHSPPADRIYGKVRRALEENGQLIGPDDLLIAAHALALGCILVKDNESEFRRVPSLEVENWIR